MLFYWLHVTSLAEFLSTGMAECPCINGWDEQDDARMTQLLANSTPGCIMIENDFGGAYQGCFPFTSASKYGSSNCRAWDDMLPYCTGSFCAERFYPAHA